MIVIETTNISDVVEENIDRSKVILADNIISNVYPLFDDIYHDNISDLKTLNSEYKKKKNKIRENKKELEELMIELKRVKKVSKLLDRVDKLVTSGLIYDGSLKHETVILLKIIDKLDDDKLEFHLRNTLKIISKRFSK